MSDANSNAYGKILHILIQNIATLDHPLEKQNGTSLLQNSESGSKILYKERFLYLAPINLTLVQICCRSQK